MSEQIQPSARHVVFVQFGEYGKTIKRFLSGEGETYYAQRYSVECVANLVAKHRRVTVVLVSEDVPEELLPNGVHVVGVQVFAPNQRPRYAQLIALLEKLGPESLIVATPMHRLFAWARQRGIDTLPLLFDSFRASGIRNRFQYWRLARMLNAAAFRWVANHSVAAAMDLVRIGVAPGKVLPFDWPAFDTPVGRPAKVLDPDAPFRVIFVGQVSIAKGARDLLLAIDQLNRTTTSREYHATFVGHAGDNLRELASHAAFPQRLQFTGPVPHAQIVERMQAHDAVVVPSRHEYPEGMPMTIYESFCARTPLIASDHPMFEYKLRDGQNCVRFAAASVSALADAIRRLSEDADLYSALSANAIAAASQHFCPLKYDQVIERWLERSPAADAFLSTYALESKS